MTPAELWRKLLRVSAVQGLGKWEDNKHHKHMGIYFVNDHKKWEAAPYLKRMVEYSVPDNCTAKRLEEIDTAAWNCIMNFEEVRTVGKPAFALTNSYMGWCGVSRNKTYNKDQELLVQWLTEFIEEV